MSNESLSLLFVNANYSGLTQFVLACLLELSSDGWCGDGWEFGWAAEQIDPFAEELRCGSWGGWWTHSHQCRCVFQITCSSYCQKPFLQDASVLIFSENNFIFFDFDSLCFLAVAAAAVILFCDWKVLLKLEILWSKLQYVTRTGGALLVIDSRRAKYDCFYQKSGKSRQWIFLTVFSCWVVQYGQLFTELFGTFFPEKKTCYLSRITTTIIFGAKLLYKSV